MQRCDILGNPKSAHNNDKKELPAKKLTIKLQEDEVSCLREVTQTESSELLTAQRLSPYSHGVHTSETELCQARHYKPVVVLTYDS